MTTFLDLRCTLCGRETNDTFACHPDRFQCGEVRPLGVWWDRKPRDAQWSEKDAVGVRDSRHGQIRYPGRRCHACWI